MPEPLTWLVEYLDLNKRAVYERFPNVNAAILCLHKVLGTGQRPRLYREVSVSLTIDVEGREVRRHRKKQTSPAPATLSDGSPSAGSGSPRAGRKAGSGTTTPRAVEAPTKEAAAQETAASPVAATAGNPAGPGSRALSAKVA